LRSSAVEAGTNAKPQAARTLGFHDASADFWQQQQQQQLLHCGALMCNHIYSNALQVLEWTECISHQLSKAHAMCQGYDIGSSTNTDHHLCEQRRHHCHSLCLSWMAQA